MYKKLFFLLWCSSSLVAMVGREQIEYGKVINVIREIYKTMEEKPAGLAIAVDLRDNATLIFKKYNPMRISDNTAKKRLRSAIINLSNYLGQPVPKAIQVEA